MKFERARAIGIADWVKHPHNLFAAYVDIAT